MAASIEEKYKLQSTQDAITGKDWAAGSAKPEETPEIIIGAGGPVVNITYAPAWSKIVDEIIVNASDHILRCVSEGLILVDEISLTMTETEITVRNTGSGIPVCVHKEATKKLARGHDIYVVEFVFGEIFQGSNTEKPDPAGGNILETLIGGTNGIGAKATNSYSRKFTVRTVDEKRQLYYEQTWTDGMNVCHPPIIKAATSKKPYTEISFEPNYKDKFSTKMTAQLAKQYMLLIRTRMILAALYANFACAHVPAPHTCVRAPMIRFNGENLSSYKTTESIAKALYSAQCISGRLIPGEKKGTRYTLPWDITVVITPIDKNQPDNLTVVNGMITHDGGHIKRARAAIVNAVKTALGGKINEADMRRVTNNVNTHTFIVMCCQIPNPEWTGQRKDVLKQTVTQFSHYDIDPKLSKGIAKALADIVRGDITEKAAQKESTTIGKIIVPPEVYTPALGAGTKNWEKMALLLCEGNSAVANSKRGGLSREKFGFLSLQGVIMNARRESEVETTEDGMRQYATQSERLQKNRSWNLLQTIIGLDANNTYAVKTKLNYGVLIMVVDQDHDGKGNILGSFLSMFGKIWPNLINRGYIKWFATPIIRAFPLRGKGRVAAFYNEYAYAEWAASKDAFPHRTRYFKGIGGHNARETQSMFKSMENHLFTFKLDAKSETLFEIYFGADPNKRKRVLSRPIRMLTVAEQKCIDETQIISCSTHLSTDTDWYQRDNLERKLDHMLDGQNQAGRKILNSLLRVCGAKEPLKVAQFAGEVAKNEDYHHGEVSLENSIFTRGLICVGAKQLPFVRPFGNFGTRSCGGKGHASARYAYLMPNEPLLNALFPHEDYCMLDFNFDDGKRKEPKNFLPIVPLAVCESTSLPAHGWKLELWARFLPDVIEQVRAMIICDSSEIAHRLRPYAYNNIPERFTGSVHMTGGEEWCYGRYKWNAAQNQIIITELPLRVWTNNYVAELQKKIGNGIVANVQNDDTEPSVINIIVTLEPGAYDTITQKGTLQHDGVIEYFKLRLRMTSHINLMSPFTSVVEFANYSDVVRAWYPYRRHMYFMRAERRIIVLGLKTIYYRNIVRYVESSNDNRFAKRKVSEMEQYLTDNGYDRIHKKYVENPGFTDNGEIEKKALGTKANYNYLIDLSDRNKSSEALAKYKAKLVEYEHALEKTKKENSLGRFQGSFTWEEELNQLEAIYYQGTATNWTFGDEDGYEYDD